MESWFGPHLEKALGPQGANVQELGSREKWEFRNLKVRMVLEQCCIAHTTAILQALLDRSVGTPVILSSAP